MKREEFHGALADFAATGSATVGDARFGQAPWVWVEHLGDRYYLNSDTTAAGVVKYLHLLQLNDHDLQWSVVANERGVENKAAFGPDKFIIEGFYLYRAL